MKSISTINNARNKLKQLSGERRKIFISAVYSYTNSREGLKVINKQIAIAKCWQRLMCAIIIPEPSLKNDKFRAFIEDAAFLIHLLMSPSDR